MTRRKSVQQLVNPLRKLSFLSSSSSPSSSQQGGHFQPDLELVPEQRSTLTAEDCQLQPSLEEDILCLFPREVILKILSLLSFQDLCQVQLTCKRWYGLTQDISIWRSRYVDLNTRFTDIYAHQPSKLIEANNLPWKTRYCQAITFANWRMGTVQKLSKIGDSDEEESSSTSSSSSRILSVKLRDQLLVTLAEDNTVKVYQYSTENGFQFKSKWTFGDPILQPGTIVECVDILPTIGILVVAQRGSKCMFYDINKGSKHDPIQVLKGGSHPWFVPDSISVNQDYFAVAGRKPSAVFVWNWRKGVRLSNRAFDNQPHNVFLSGDNLITVSVDGLLHVFDIFDTQQNAAISTHYLSACSIPCIEYDDSLSIVLAPHASRRIHHYKWNPALHSEEQQVAIEQDKAAHDTTPPIVQPTASISTPTKSLSARRRLSNTFINLLKLKNNNSKNTTLYNIPSNSLTQPSLVTASSTSTNSLKKKSSREFYKSVRIRRHSSYNDYGYACQMKTDQYIKQLKQPPLTLPKPNFQDRPRLVHSIRTTPLGNSAKEIINVAIHGERVATVNRQGDISLYALNGTTAARVFFSTEEEEGEAWMERDGLAEREDDDLSDGYDFVRSRLAMGSMGFVYGTKNGTLWWLDFGCRSA